MAMLTTHDASGLTSLPVELLHHVFAQLGTRDVASTRLTCSLLATVGAEHLMEEVYLYHDAESFSRLNAISQHPLIPKNVTSLKFYANRIRKYSNIEDFDSSGESPVGVSKNRLYISRLKKQILSRLAISRDPSTSPGRIGPLYLHGPGVPKINELHQIAYEAAKELYNEQEHIQRSLLDFYALIALLQNAPSLRSIWLDPAQDRTKTGMGAGPYADSCPPSAGVYQLVTTCAAILASRAQVKQLTAARIGYMLGDLSPQEVVMFKASLQHLQQFRLSMTLLAHNDGYIDPTADRPETNFEPCFTARRLYSEKRLLYHLLTAMPDLRVLRLDFPEGAVERWEDNPTIIDLHDIVGNHTWPQLRDISLCRISANEDEMVAFLLRHRESLRRIRLCDVVLLQGRWGWLLSRIAGQFPNIARIDLIGSFKAVNHIQPALLELEYEFPTVGQSWVNSIIITSQDLLEAYVRDGGEFPNINLLWEETSREHVPDQPLPRMLPWLEEDNDPVYDD